MKKLLQLFTVIFCFLAIQNGYSAADRAADTLKCPEDYPIYFRSADPCWQMFCHMEPYDYQVTYCIEQEVPYEIECCRMVNRPFEVERTMQVDCEDDNPYLKKDDTFVAQYYTETICREEPEYYTETRTRIEKKLVCELRQRCIPRYYWKKVCAEGCVCANSKHPLIAFEKPDYNPTSVELCNRRFWRIYWGKIISTLPPSTRFPVCCYD